MEIVPCSRVGHVFRRDVPYFAPEDRVKILNNNVCRMVDVWLDDWTMFFYNLYPLTLEGKEGEIQDRRELIKNNNCKGNLPKHLHLLKTT